MDKDTKPPGTPEKPAKRHLFVGAKHHVEWVAAQYDLKEPPRIVKYPDQVQGYHGEIVFHMCGTNWRSFCPGSVLRLLMIYENSGVLKIERVHHD